MEMSNRDSTPPGILPLRTWEFILVPAVILLQCLFAGDRLLLTRSFWLDEIHTQLFVDDPSWDHAWTALAHGVDFNPPTYFVIARLAASIGFAPELTLRLLALACVLVCCICVFILLREILPTLTALVAALLIWSIPAVQTQAFEARFYAPWMAATALFCLAVRRALQSPGLTRDCGIAAGSIFLCTLHYFGIITLGLIVAPVAITSRRGFRVALASLPGVLSLACCLPTFYRGQRAALSVPTWVPDVTWLTATTFLWQTIPAGALGLALLTAMLLLRRAKQPIAAIPPGLGLVLLPLVLLSFSLAAQPALIPRYACPAAVGFAFAFGALMQRAPRPLVAVAGLWFIAGGVESLSVLTAQFQRTEQRQTQMIDRLRQLDRQTLILFESRHAMYPIVRYAPDLASRIRFLTLSNDNLARFHSATPFRIVERDVAETIETYYPQFATMRYDALESLPRSYVVAFRQRKEFGDQFAAFDVRQVSPPLYELRRRDLMDHSPVTRSRTTPPSLVAIDQE